MRISDWSSDVCSSDLSAGQQTIFRNTRCRRKSGRRTEWLFSKMADRHTIALKRKESGMATISKTNGLVGGTLASDINHRLREDIVSCVLEQGPRLRFQRLKVIYGHTSPPRRKTTSRLIAGQL